MTNWNTNQNGEFLGAFLNETLTNQQLRHLFHSIEELKLNHAHRHQEQEHHEDDHHNDQQQQQQEDSSSTADTTSYNHIILDSDIDVNNLSLDLQIIANTQAILVKVILSMCLRPTEGIILCCSPSSRSSSSGCGNGGNSDGSRRKNSPLPSSRRKDADHTSASMDRTDPTKPSFLAIEILAQLQASSNDDDNDIKINIEQREQHQQPVIRISYASSNDSQKALIFLRDVPRDKIQWIQVNQHQRDRDHDHEHDHDDANEIDNAEEYMDIWKMECIHQFIRGKGLLDAHSGLRVHEGVILPYCCSDGDHDDSLPCGQDNLMHRDDDDDDDSDDSTYNDDEYNDASVYNPDNERMRTSHAARNEHGLSGSLIWRNGERDDCNSDYECAGGGNESASGLFYGNEDGNENGECERERQQNGGLVKEQRDGRGGLIGAEVAERSWLDCVEIVFFGLATVIQLASMFHLDVTMMIYSFMRTYMCTYAFKNPIVTNIIEEWLQMRKSEEEFGFVTAGIAIGYIFMSGLLCSYRCRYAYGLSNRPKRSKWRTIGTCFVRCLFVLFFAVYVLDGIVLVECLIRHIQGPAALVIEMLYAKLGSGKEILVDQSLLCLQLAWTWVRDMCMFEIFRDVEDHRSSA
jgi:hypothetical protein